MILNLLTQVLSKNGLTHAIMSYITYVVHHMTSSQDKKKLSIALTVLHFYNIYTSVHNHLDNSVAYHDYPLVLLSIYSSITFALAFVIERVLTDGMTKEGKMKLVEELSDSIYKILYNYPVFPHYESKQQIPPPPTNTPQESPRLTQIQDNIILDENDILTDIPENTPTISVVDLISNKLESFNIEPTVENVEDKNGQEARHSQDSIVGEVLEEKAQEVIDNSCVFI